MRRLSSLIRGYTRNRTILVTVAACLLFDVLALARIVFPSVFDFIIKYHVFEAVSILALSQVLLLVLQIANAKRQHILFSDRDCEAELLAFLAANSNATTVLFFSAGLGARIGIIREIATRWSHLGLRVLAQHPDTHLDKDDAMRLGPQLNLVQKGDVPSRQHFEIRLSRLPATIRAIIVCDKSSKPLWAVASWFVYGKEARGVVIRGRDNPAFILDASRDTDEGDALAWLQEQFATAWETAKIDVAYPI
jgi:hypothetical protein